MRKAHAIGIAAIGGLLAAGTCMLTFDRNDPSDRAGAIAVVPAAATSPVVVAAAPTPPANPVVPANRPLPSRHAAAVAAHRDMPTVAALAGKGVREQAILGTAMTTQERDPARAEPVEAAMRAAFGRLPGLAAGSDPVRVTCVATTCEVTGTAAAGQSAADLQHALRDPALMQAVVERGYMPGPITVATVGSATRFVMYLNDEM